MTAIAADKWRGHTPIVRIFLNSLARSGSILPPSKAAEATRRSEEQLKQERIGSRGLSASCSESSPLSRDGGGDWSRRYLGSIKRVLLLTCVSVLWCGCSITTVRFTGTTGASYSGDYSLKIFGEPWKIEGSVPGRERNVGVFMPAYLLRLQSCELHKVNTNSLLRVDLHERHWHVTVVSPPGTSGVRLTWEGNGYKSEILK